MKGLSAVLLAGGKSTRMGKDKAALTFHGVTFLEWQVQKLQGLGIEDIMISGDCGAVEGARVIADEYLGRGPLSGMHACMKQARNPDCLILSVDMPRVPAQALAELAEAHQAAGAAITLLQHGEKWEPLIGVYKSSLFRQIEPILHRENTAVRRLLSETGFEVLRWPEDKTVFCNCNTPQDYELLIQAEQTSGPDVTSHSEGETSGGDEARVNSLGERNMPGQIQVRGARVHNLKNIDVDVPLNQIVAIAGVSGSGKSSLALGVLYAEGSRRYLEALSTYTRRRMTQAARAQVDEVHYVPAALALHQRPVVPGIRSTFGTGTELLNSLRLMFSRLASHRCHNGHYLPPTLAVAAEQPIFCPECGERVQAPGAEELAFNSQGACPACDGTGIVRTVDESTLVPDESLSIDQGAVAPWQTLMWSLMKDIAREMGVRTDVPFCQLTAEERDIVFHGPAVKKSIVYQNRTSGAAGDMDFTYFNATYTVENALSKVKDEKGMKRVEKFLKQGVCPDCGGTRLSAAARAPRLRGLSLDEVCKMPLTELVDWVAGVPGSLPGEMRPMAESICQSFQTTAKRLMDLGLGYLSLDRASSTLSTGERQRMQLARAVRNRTTGVLYVLDEPSIGLHPSNIVGLTGVMRDLAADGNSVILVDHDTQILSQADWLIELGPEAGANGGRVVAQGTIPEIVRNKASQIGPFLAGTADVRVRSRAGSGELFELGKIRLSTAAIHTVKPLKVDIPKGRLTVITGVSGSGKTTLILESLVPGLTAAVNGQTPPEHVLSLEAGGIRQVKLIDATPIGVNVRSTVATYANVHDELRKIFARTPAAKELGLKAGDFSYNTGRLRCPGCDGTGVIDLDVQFLPDVTIPCPECHGSRYGKQAGQVRHGEYSLPDLMAMDVNRALEVCRDWRLVRQRLQVLKDLGLGYLTLGEETPSLSGGEAQRLKLASEMGKTQSDSVFVFDEPTIGLHPLDVRTLLGVFQTLIEHGATVVVIEHDLDVIRNADYIIDMGPGGGEAGGRVVAAGTPEEIAENPDSVTGQYLK